MGTIVLTYKSFSVLIQNTASSIQNV